MIPQYPPMIGYLQLSWLPLSSPDARSTRPSSCEFLASVARSTPPRRLVLFLLLPFLTREKRDRGKGMRRIAVFFCIKILRPSVPFVLTSWSILRLYCITIEASAATALHNSYLTYEQTYVTTNSGSDEKRRNTRQPNCNAELFSADISKQESPRTSSELPPPSLHPGTRSRATRIDPSISLFSLSLFFFRGAGDRFSTSRLFS